MFTPKKPANLPPAIRDNKEPFDLNKEFETEVEPLVKQIRAVCERLHIPYLAVFAVARDGQGGWESISSAMLRADEGYPYDFHIAATAVTESGSACLKEDCALHNGVLIQIPRDMLQGPRGAQPPKCGPLTGPDKTNLVQ